ncbi:MAG: hypothetical protein JXA15_12925 [Spirochaetales bacterium]|nr:hypothetical protein [Spirochaetales bacterium]
MRSILRYSEPAFLLGSVGILAVLLSFSYDAAILAAAFLTLLLAALFHPGRLKGWIPAVAITAAWMLVSGRMYEGYNVFKLELFGLAVFPMVAWPTGLAFAYLYLVPAIRLRPWLKRWALLALVYSIGIIAAEWLGYHALGVHLDRGTAFRGWPILDIFHCPWWMQLAYFANGILFMGAASWMDRDRPAAGKSTSEA